jgi:hypothetical protein
MKSKLLKVCRVVAVVAASVSLVYNMVSGNWIGVSINAATLAVVL